MNLYLLKQDVNNWYDTYDSCIVCAENEDEARLIRPDGDNRWNGNFREAWANKPEQVKVQLIGKADDSIEKGVVLSSFNAG